MTTPSSRPQVNVYSISGSATSTLKLPDVFKTPIRTDVIHFVHSNIAKNKRQPYGVMSHHGPNSRSAGHQNSAHSWGTGRAVSRIPRVGGSGTHRSGQGAIGNMCRGGHMFAPTKIWRKWHRRVNKKTRRYATASALAASALPSLVEARGHRIEKLPELPIVLDDSVEQLVKTKEAEQLLKSIGAFEDIKRVVKGKSMRAGKGKMRGRRYSKRRGPLIVYKKDEGIVKAFRNIPGVDLCCVERLNLLQLAPGSHSGRLIIWTEGAFKALDEIFGSFTSPSLVKKDFILPRYNILSNADISRVINSVEVQSVLRPAKENNGTKKTYKIDPFKEENKETLKNLNPFYEEMNEA